MSKNIKQLIVPLLFLVSLILLLIFPNKHYIIDYTEVINNDIIGEITKNDYIVQEFTSENNYRGFGFKFANYSKIINSGKLTITITDTTNNKTKVIKKKLKNLLDNQYFFLKYKLKKNHHYIVSIKSNSKNIITFYSTMDNKNSKKLYLNGNLQNSNLQMSFRNEEKKYDFIWYYIFALSIYIFYKMLVVGESNEK